MFRGREMAFKDQGRRILEKFAGDLGAHGQLERNPSMLGRVMSVVVTPKTGK